jgi:hypothetical protein
MNILFTFILILAIIFLIWWALQKSGKQLYVDHDRLNKSLGTSQQSISSKKTQEPRWYVDHERLLGKEKPPKTNEKGYYVDTDSLLGDWGKKPSKKEKEFKGFKVDFSDVLGKKKKRR